SCLAAARSGLASMAVESAWGKLMLWARAAGAINPEMTAQSAAIFQGETGVLGKTLRLYRGTLMVLVHKLR
ncbi:hypothetical protein C9975_09500, partial [Thalassospira xiamenensis]